MKVLVSIGQGAVTVSILLNLGSCGWSSQSLTVDSQVGGNSQTTRQTQRRHRTPEAQQTPQMDERQQKLVGSMGVLNKELGGVADSQGPKQQLNFLDPHTFSSIADLAKNYNNLGEKKARGAGSGKQTDQEKIAYLKDFFEEQKVSTMAFAFQLRGDYKQAADIMAQRIAFLESANADGSRSHSLALSYGQYAGYLSRLGRTAEAEQVLLKAHAIEPNHY
jgi:hypothetical protein